MTPDDRAQLRALLAAATPGEWAPGTPDDDVAEEPPMTLPTCPREDCTFTDPHHDHDKRTGEVRDRSEESDCACDASTPYYTRCYAPRTPQPQPAAVVLPTVDEVADIIKAGGFYSDITRAQLDAAAIAARNEFYGADRGPEATSEWREVVAAALNAYTTAAEPEDPCVELVAEELHNLFSQALDRGIVHHIPWSAWRRLLNRPVRAEVFRGWLVPDLMSVRAALDEEPQP